MEVSALSVVLVTFTVYSAIVVDAETGRMLYKRCHEGLTYSGQELGSAMVEREQDCARSCSKSHDCKAVTVCPEDDTARANCTFIGDHNPNMCAKLDTAVPSSCYFAQKVCQNGGTPYGDEKCACPIQYSGRYCERYIRDCTEAYLNGYQSPALDGIYYIQPINSTRAFLVHCVFNWGGLTSPMWRETNQPGWPIGLNWTSLKDPFGDLVSQNFFIGLENLHVLLAQANYLADFNINGPSNAKVFYDTMKVGSETERYTLTYNYFFPGSNLPNSVNGMDKSAGPLLFATSDNDLNGCAATKGAPGWYAGGCNQYSFLGDTVKWPVSGTDVTMWEINMFLGRTGDFL